MFITFPHNPYTQVGFSRRCDRQLDLSTQLLALHQKALALPEGISAGQHLSAQVNASGQQLIIREGNYVWHFVMPTQGSPPKLVLLQQSGPNNQLTPIIAKPASIRAKHYHRLTSNLKQLNQQSP